ncbi:MAG: DNA polymerase I [bacterium]|jgi:DNA polymerase-1|nr:DNA polymerase I [Bacillota bacterium]HHW55926.1 DNA polymerase I [Bacillota bacterium]
MGKKLILIDGNSLVHRAFHAIPPLTTGTGQHTNAVYGFTTMFLRLLEDERPDYLAVAFDKGKVTFRHGEFEDYKANRTETPDELRSQFPLVKELLEAYRVPIFEQEGYEADDLLGTLARKAEAEGFSVLIVSGDRDVLQLVSPRVTVLFTRRGISELEVMDAGAVEEYLGVPPEQVADYKGLVGDQSDNIPGVPGIGPKTATKLLKEFENLEEILSDLEGVRQKGVRSKLEEYCEQARLSKRLATIVCDIPLDVDWEELQRKEPDWDAVTSLFRELEFRSLLQRVAPDLPVQVETGYQVVASPSQLEALAARSREEGKLAFTLIGSGEDPRQREILGCALALPGRELYYLPRSLWQEVKADLAVAKVMASLFSEAAVKKYTHDAKAAYQLLNLYQIQLAGLAMDTMIASYLLNPAASHSLDQIASTYLNEAVPSWEELVGKGKKAVKPTSLKEEDLAPFMATRTAVLLPLQERLAAELERLDLATLYEEVELPLIQVLAAMEEEGVTIDTDALAEMGAEIGYKLAAIEGEIYQMAGEEFNLNSPKQLSTILFEKLKLPVIKRTKTGYSTDAEVLEKLADVHPIVERILEYRQLMKLKSTYIDGLMALVDPATGKVHTTFNQAVTTTGRLSSTEPNLQNIPIRLELGRRLRKAFVPGRSGDLILAADYSQIELRVLAHISQDPYLLESFRRGQDVHRRTAAEIFGVSLEEVTPEMRERAKAVNFGIVYGISDYGLSRDLGVPRREAKEYIDNYFARYAGVKAYIDGIVAEAREKGYVTTLMKRRRYLPDINSRNYTLRSFAERTAMNTPIQGSAADIIKTAMVEVFRQLKERRLATRLLLQVHDELIFTVPREELAEVKALVKECMEGAVELDVPLVVELKVGENWYEVKKES